MTSFSKAIRSAVWVKPNRAV